MEEGAPVAAVEEEPAAIEPEPAAVEEIPVEEAVAEPEPEPEPKPPIIHKPVLRKPPVRKTEAHEPAAVAQGPEAPAHTGALQNFVSDLESSLGDEFLPGTVTQPAPAAPAPAAHAKAAAAPTQPAPVLGEFVADIEASLGEDFLKAAPVPQSQPAVAKAEPAALKPAAPAESRVESKKVSPLAASAAASASPSSAVASAVVHTVQTPAAAVASAIPAASKPQPAAPVLPPIAPAPAAKASPFGEDAGIDLADMFGELKRDLEADVASADEDPETHYNLGIAFREMGLLDEAIGELQKACQSFDRGHPFQQIMQTYTWLAQCFLEKGVPEAAIRWYDKALNVPNIDGETRTALNYELASAHETAGDKTSALKHFMDVYGSNIDYRDVSERIKALKS